MPPPLSQVRTLGDTVYTAGQCGIDPKTGAAYEEFTKEVSAALRGLAEALEGAGSTINEVVRVTVYLTDIGLFEPMNAEYVKVFSPPYPARSTLVTGLVLPGLRFEIDAVAGLRPSAR